MKSFLIDIDKNGSHCECSVQQVGYGANAIFLLSLGDGILLRRFHRKRIVLNCSNRHENELRVFWEALEHHQSNQAKKRDHYIKK